jgi:GntR family transcriptional regulator
VSLQRHPEAAARPLDRSSPLPLWAQLRAELERRLAAGHFAARFPTDQELTDAYGVSRQTAREAVRRLGASVALDRQRGRGTFVRTTEFEQPVGALYSLFRAIEAEGVEQRSVVRAQELRTDPVVAVELGLDPGADLVYLERIRLAAGEPLALDRTWLPAELAAAVVDADFSHTALYDELQRRCGIRPTSGDERIHPVVVKHPEARLLGLPSGSPAFRVQRRTRAGSRPLERRSTLVRGDRYAFVTSWSGAASGAREAQLTMVAS